MLEPRDAAEQRRDGQPRFAETALPDRDTQRVRAARCVPHIGRDRVASRGLEDFHCLGLDPDGANVLAVGLVEHERGAVLQRVMEHVAAHGDCGAMKHRVHVDRSVIAHVFAEWPFRLHIAALVEIALKGHLGVGRD